MPRSIQRPRPPPCPTSRKGAAPTVTVRPPIHGRALYSRAGEGEIAGALDETVAQFAGVEVGSYPHLDAADYRVKITLDGRDAAAVDRALAFLAARLGDAVARTE